MYEILGARAPTVDFDLFEGRVPCIYTNDEIAPKGLPHTDDMAVRKPLSVAVVNNRQANDPS